MYLKSIIIIILLFICANVSAQHIISGKVTNKKGVPIYGANITIAGTIEGTTTDSVGKFSFETKRTDSITLYVTYIGYDRYSHSGKIADLANMVIALSEAGKNLEEVVIKASSFNLGKTPGLKQMDALDIVMTGSSNGDIFRALQALPGTQIVGEDGKLYVRGGSERETQTFIDGMHVLEPYSSTAQNMPSRGRFSPFLFKGINFSTGGYESEYGQALSAVLPMDTKDVTLENKLGINVSPLDFGGGGTYVLGKKSSISANVNYTDLGLYDQVLPDHYDWKRNYHTLSAETQFKTDFGKSGVFKVYGAFDQTGFIQAVTDTLNNIPKRNFQLKQNNYYINSTFRTQTANHVNLFFGAAFSYVDNTYNNVNYKNDQYTEQMSELHLKFKASKYITKGYKLTAGAEDYQEDNRNHYIDTLLRPVQNKQFTNNIVATFIDNQFKILKHLYGNASGRAEYADFDKKTVFAPRLSLSYINGSLQLSAILGQYYQMPDNQYVLAVNNNLREESATHYILGGSYDLHGLFFKVEAYYKEYKNLAWLNQAIYTSQGFGTSRGIDFYLSDQASIKNIKYDISYSYNDSRRLFANYPVVATPQFVTKHNARLNFRYYFSPIKTYLGVSNSFASGRPYNDVNEPVFMNSLAKPYYSLDGNLTFLLNKSLVLYTSMSNVLNRENVYGYNYSTLPNQLGVYKSAPVTSSRDRFFYIGLFISLNKNSAYDVSNF
jgi:hypothetical protein